MNILVIAPHPDDESIGCGGAICLHQERGDRTVVVCLTSGELGLKRLSRGRARRVREGEARRAASILGVAGVRFLRQPDWTLGEHPAEAIRALREILREEKPSLIYVPHKDEWHPDHQAAGRILRRALGGRRKWPELRAYEVWTPLPEHDRVEDISRVMSRKLRALRAHRSQLAEFDYARAVIGLNAFRGALVAKCRYAEVFQTLAREDKA